jgi:ABC-type uncharacterized transport system permease subunit
MYVVDEAERGLLPSWGDSIALPIFGMLFLQLIGLPFVAVTLWVLGRRARRTSSLWVRSDYSSIYSGVVAALAAIATLGLLYFITIEVLRGPGYGLPTLLGLGYLILVVRALVVSPVNSDEREQGQ